MYSHFKSPTAFLYLMLIILFCKLVTVAKDFKMRVWGNEMFGISWRKCSTKAVRKFLGRFPFHVALLTVHLILVSPPDSLHGSGGVRSCSGPQSRWVSHTPLCFPPFLYLRCHLEKCMHKILLGRHSCG